ncbi:MAG: FAD-binding oxidoreductase [Lautropia sp.]|nr:FAD-binding oxidoreductase [Lautropia sp.]
MPDPATTDSLLTSLRAVFSGRLLSTPADMRPWLHDYRQRWTGPALAVVQPDSTTDVAAVVCWCRNHDAVIVPQGGNTGLTGAAVPLPPSSRHAPRPVILLSLTRMNRIRDLDIHANILEAEAGCTLQHVQEVATGVNRLFPLSLAAEGSCTIGGNLSTNAGGVQVLRYGNMRDLCLGLEVVTADGRIWNGLNRLRKNNTGYDLRDLFIGAEGTLGIITAATLKLHPLPAGQAVALIQITSPAQALSLLSLAQEQIAYELSAFELISDAAMQLVLQHIPDTRLPFSPPAHAPWYILLESSSLRNEQAARQALEDLLTKALESRLVTNAVISQSATQFAHIWQLRENISSAQSRQGKNVKHDISVPISSISNFLQQAEYRLKQRYPQAQLIVFGHMGDGNLHFNVAPHGQFAQQYDDMFFHDEKQINRLVHDLVAEYGGAISAEHGIGVLRQEELLRYKQPIELDMMHAIKHSLDPDNRMNPGKLLPEKYCPPASRDGATQMIPSGQPPGH